MLVGDGRFSNRTCFRAASERTGLLTRVGKDAVVCYGAPAGSRRICGERKFSPEQPRQDESIPWQTTKVFHAGKRGRRVWIC
jgi:hypothetical protein